MLDIFRNEDIPMEINGQVDNIILFKGTNVTLQIQRKDGGKEEIAIANQIKDIVKRGDIFIKKRNSNKCKILRNDSIIYVDCFNIPNDIRDSIGKIDEWPQDKKNYWQKQ